MGFPSSFNFTNKFISENPMIAQRVSDWFASMARVGGKTKWQRDYFVTQKGRQVYNLDIESSVPYKAGTRRINRVMWVMRPEIMGGQQNPAYIDGGLLSFGQAGLMYGANLLSYLGTIFDVILILQSLEERNRVLRSEFFYSISGDKVEISPMPGSGYTGLPDRSRVYYYYFNESDFLGLDGQGPDGEEGLQELIANPTQVKVDVMPWSQLNTTARNWIENYTLALAKYAYGSKLRAIKKIASPDSDYQVEFDYSELITESKDERTELFRYLEEDLLSKMDFVKLYENKAAIMEASAKINRLSPRKIYVG
jgi:hypothetical protein